MSDFCWILTTYYDLLLGEKWVKFNRPTRFIDDVLLIRHETSVFNEVEILQ